MSYGRSAICCFLLVSGSFSQARGQVIPHHQTKPPGPALTPAEAVKQMTVPEGFSVELVAAEPQIMNPVAMTWDDVRGCYVGIWSDMDGNTTMPLGDGHMDQQGAIVTVRCEDEVTVREILTITSEDEHVREIYRTSVTGEEFLSMRLEMTRIQAKESAE